MHVLLFVLAFASMVGAGAIFAVSSSAAHEVQALILVLAFAVLLGAGFVVESLARLREDIRNASESRGR